MLNPEIKSRLNWLTILMSLCLVIFINCSVVDRVTPSEIDELSADYAGDPNAAGLSSLWRAKNVRNLIITNHAITQRNLLRAIEDDEWLSAMALDLSLFGIQRSEDVQEIVIGGPDQPLSILGILGPGITGVFLGKMLKRRGDYTPEQHHSEVAKAVNNSKNNLTS